MAKTGRTKAYSPEEDFTLISLRADRHPYSYIKDSIMTGRSVRSLQGRVADLEASGEAQKIRDFLKAS
jgi:hypothetical protein